MIIPNPAAAIVTMTDTDPVTGVADERSHQVFLKNPVVAEGALIYEGSDGNVHAYALVDQLTSDGLSLVATLEGGGTIRVREIDPYDALLMSTVKIPQPVDAIKAAILGGGHVANELDAVVAPDNSVATLMLETSVGVYVRFSRAWQLLAHSSTALDSMSLVAVSAGALEVWDQGEATNSRVMVSDFPIDINQGEIDAIWEPSAPDEKMPKDGIVVASGSSIPDIEDMDDLAIAVRFGQTNPASRWFIEKRAAALGAQLPVWKKTA